MKHLLTLFDLTPAELSRILTVAGHLKAGLQRGERPPILANHTLALLFEKPSLRTRVSFEAGMSQLGGTSLFLGEDVGWGKRETPADFTRVLGEYVDVVACRAKSHQCVAEMASFNAVPIINALTDLSHPCQSLADLMTLQESLGDVKKRHLVFVGDGNNVARSTALACAMLGMRFTLACPLGYEIDTDWLAQIMAAYPDASIAQTRDPLVAVRDADAIYTDVWTSMGQEAEKKTRREAFARYQVNGALIAASPSHVRVLHCLPAVRGEEITDEVMDHACCDAIAQAGNRMHAQKALLVQMLRPQWIDAHVPASITS